MAQRHRLVERQPWLLWILLGMVAGASVVALLGAIVAPVDRLAYGSYDTDAWSLPLLYASIGGSYGAVGGLTAGAICGAITAIARRRGTASRSIYGITAAATTAGLAASFGAWLGLADESRPGEVLLWFLMPVAVVSATAYAIGRLVWRRTSPRPHG